MEKGGEPLKRGLEKSKEQMSLDELVNNSAACGTSSSPARDFIFLNFGYKFLSSEYSQGKSFLKLNSSAYEKYEYGHLGCWYIKLTLFNWF